MAFSCFQWIVGGWSQQLTAGDQKHAPEGEVSAETCVESWISTDAAGWSQQLTTGDQKHAPEVETAEPKLKVLPTLNLPVLDGPGESPSETKTAPEGDDGDVKADKADKVTKNTSKRNARLPLMVQAVELPDYVPILPRSQDDEKWPLVTKVEVLKKWEAPKRPPKPMPQIVTGRRQDRRFYGKALKRVPRWDPRPADYASLPEGMLLVFSQDGRRAIGQQPPDRCNAIPAIPLVYRVHHPIAAQSSWQVQISQPPGLRMVAVPAVPA